MKRVTPNPEQEEDTVSDSECVTEKEPVAKKPKTGLGKLLGGMSRKKGMLLNLGSTKQAKLRSSVIPSP